MAKRRWEVIWFPYPYWHLHLFKGFGKPQYGGRYLTETWVGPLCVRVWKSASAVHPTKAFRRAHINP